MTECRQQCEKITLTVALRFLGCLETHQPIRIEYIYRVLPDRTPARNQSSQMLSSIITLRPMTAMNKMREHLFFHLSLEEAVEFASWVTNCFGRNWLSPWIHTHQHDRVKSNCRLLRQRKYEGIYFVLTSRWALVDSMKRNLWPIFATPAELTFKMRIRWAFENEMKDEWKNMWFAGPSRSMETYANLQPKSNNKSYCLHIFVWANIENIRTKKIKKISEIFFRWACESR